MKWVREGETKGGNCDSSGYRNIYIYCSIFIYNLAMLSITHMSNGRIVNDNWKGCRKKFHGLFDGTITLFAWRD
jgi:hypothetical protein